MKRGKSRLVLDSTPLIYLAKTSLLEPLCRSFHVYIPGSVRDEATGDARYPDALTISDLIDRGLIRVQPPKDAAKLGAFLRHSEIHRGEAEAMALAQELEATAVIDDGGARALAKLYGVAVTPGTLSLLFLLVASGKLTPAEAEAKLEDLVDAGLYLDPRTLIAARRRLREHRAG